MATKTQTYGFTIVEVVLFLAISGALAIGIIGSAMVGINMQRYSDSVTSFKAEVQTQFSRTYSVSNPRSDSDSSCEIDSDESTELGTTECLILGRILTVDIDGQVTAANLISTQKEDVINSSDTDEQQLASLEPAIDTVGLETSSMAWDTRITNGSNIGPVSLVILRAPSTGNVHSYVRHGVAYEAVPSEPINRFERFVEDLQSGNITSSDPQYMCVDESGYVTSGMRAVVLQPFASGPANVDTSSVEAGDCS